ncbi:TetR/AcrR family transcriptional regulator [Streptacidiphilus sp. N1-12]|uniref:TetR/AcrR family transcriptional regulator n=2 Tax=Streptacidiphilus alkalitolerans TaxID=3342712 RepID=A0ABV6W9D8_9ACTN
MGTSQAAKVETHDRILEIAAARIRRDGAAGLAVAEIMKEAGLTHGGFYRHFDSREQLVTEAVQRALARGSEWTVASGELGGRQGYTKLVDGYLSGWHRDHPEAGCGIAGVAADMARDEGAASDSYTEQVRKCLAVLVDLIDGPDPRTVERESLLALSALVGAISIARAVDDPTLSDQLLADVAAALKDRTEP